MIIGACRKRRDRPLLDGGLPEWPSCTPALKGGGGWKIRLQFSGRHITINTNTRAHSGASYFQLSYFIL
jgi:hypothetical protein